MDVVQCPACELRFRFASELDDHMGVEHPAFDWEPRSLEDDLLAAQHRPRRLLRRYPPVYKPDPPPGDPPATGTAR